MESSNWNIEKQKLNKKKAEKIRNVFAGIFAIIGVLILLSQVSPVLSSYISGVIYEYRAGILAKPIPDAHKEYISGDFAYYNPGESYFQNLVGTLTDITNTDLETSSSVSLKIDQSYSREMKISIKDIGINNIIITPNVESYDENIYNKELKKGVAHFKGTPIPGDGGNSFIYGHSAVPSFMNRNNNIPEVIFSKLENIDIGNEVVINKEGENLKYIVRNKKIIDPTDFTVFKQSGGKETVTLMTCWPLGIPAKRLIVIAEKYE